jgi:sulfate/thiosulfate transport system substrate-binding protein
MTRSMVSIALFAGAAVLWGAGASNRGADQTDTLAIGAYSVVRDAFREAILPGFARHWEKKSGRKIRYEESYSGSGAQARAIASGYDADVAILSLEGDIDLLVKAGLVRKDWRAVPHGGMITRSLVVIGYRDGNPKGIHDWEDLTQPGVGVVYPDPKTSGGARWNVNAIYGAGLFCSKRSKPDREAARDLLSRVQANVITMDASGRQSMATFDRGTGDAVVTYENELLLQGKIAGRRPAYAIPPATLLIEGPAAVVDASVARHGNRAVAEAFLDYLRSDEAQRILADYGFRPLESELVTNLDRAPLPARLFTMADLGGWGKNKKELFETGGVWDALFTDRTRKGVKR